MLGIWIPGPRQVARPGMTSLACVSHLRLEERRGVFRDLVRCGQMAEAVDEAVGATPGENELVA